LVFGSMTLIRATILFSIMKDNAKNKNIHRNVKNSKR